MRKTILIGLVLTMLLAICGVLPAIAQNEEEYVQVATFSGKGDKTTALFRVSGEKWRVTWTVEAEEPEYVMFGFFVYPEGETAMFVAYGSQDGVGGDTTYVYEGGGNFYIAVIAANLEQWVIVVEDCVTAPSAADTAEPPANGNGLSGC